MIDYAYMALTLANLSSIPVRLYRDGTFAGLFHNSKFKPDLAILEEPNIFKNNASVSYYMTEEFLFYGLFRVKEEPVSMVLGPVAQLTVDRARAERILLSIGESPARAPELQNYLRSISMRASQPSSLPPHWAEIGPTCAPVSKRRPGCPSMTISPASKWMKPSACCGSPTSPFMQSRSTWAIPPKATSKMCSRKQWVSRP